VFSSPVLCTEVSTFRQQDLKNITDADIAPGVGVLCAVNTLKVVVAMVFLMKLTSRCLAAI